MNQIYGIILIIIGIIVGLYIGLWVLFIGGIIQIVEAIRAEYFIPMDLGIGVVKMVLASTCGGLAGYAFIIPGYLMLKE